MSRPGRQHTSPPCEGGVGGGLRCPVCILPFGVDLPTPPQPPRPNCQGENEPSFRYNPVNGPFLDPFFSAFPKKADRPPVPAESVCTTSCRRGGPKESADGPAQLAAIPRPATPGRSTVLSTAESDPRARSIHPDLPAVTSIVLRPGESAKNGAAGAHRCLGWESLTNVSGISLRRADGPGSSVGGCAAPDGRNGLLDRLADDAGASPRRRPDNPWGADAAETRFEPRVKWAAAAAAIRRPPVPVPVPKRARQARRV